VGFVLVVLALARPALATPVVAIAPSSKTVTQGDSFTLDVSIAGAVDLYGFQFDVEFNPLVLTATDVTEGPFLATGGSTLFFPGDFTTTPGLISFNGGSLTGLVPGVSGGGVLAHLSFTATQAGSSAITLSNGLFVDSALVEIAAALVGGDVTINRSTQSPTVPEPATLMLVASGIAAAVRRRRKTA